MLKNKIKIAVISGGLSNERKVSIKTGRQVFNNLSEENYDKFLVEITHDGKWLLSKNNLKLGSNSNKIKTLTLMHPNHGVAKNDLKDFDLVFLALHGRFGEDGKIQAILDILDVPYTGSGVLASALGMNKIKTMEFLKGMGVKTPNSLFFSNKQNIDLKVINKMIKENINYPCVVKPNESGSSIGVNIIKSFSDLEQAIYEAYKADDQILVEEFLKGREITCGVLGNSNQTELEALPPAEIITDRAFFDYKAKYFSNKTQEICPANISAEQSIKVKDLAKTAHKALGCDGLTRSDFILKDNEFYFLEINTLPGLTEQSICPKEAKAAGMTFAEFLDKQVKLAIIKSKEK